MALLQKPSEMFLSTPNISTINQIMCSPVWGSMAKEEKHSIIEKTTIVWLGRSLRRENSKLVVGNPSKLDVST